MANDDDGGVVDRLGIVLFMSPASYPVNEPSTGDVYGLNEVVNAIESCEAENISRRASPALLH